RRPPRRRVPIRRLFLCSRVAQDRVRPAKSRSLQARARADEDGLAPAGHARRGKALPRALPRGRKAPPGAAAAGGVTPGAAIVGRMGTKMVAQPAPIRSTNEP